jgi:peptidoglycan/LPS O-acetylase OafA/YrhL
MYVPLNDSIPKSVHSIRPEIQILRAIAIAFVLAFHLWKNIFKNGYMGVDM